MLQSDIRHDLSRTFYAPLDGTAPGEIETIFAELEARGRQVLRAEEVPEERMQFVCTADMRYVGQEYFVNLVVPHEEPIGDRSVASMSEWFHAAYQVRYGHSTPDAPLELVNLRVVAIGALAGRVEGFQPAAPDVAEAGRRRVIFAGVAHDAVIYPRHTLPLGFTCSGPAIVEEETATTVVPPGWQGTVDRLGNVILKPVAK
jgi:N-methylhydantoinase A